MVGFLVFRVVLFGIFIYLFFENIEEICVTIY